MLKRLLILTTLCLISSPIHAIDATRPMQPGEFLVLAYHAIPAKAIPGDAYSVPQALFTEQMEYLRRHGYQPVSISDILLARQGKKPLPARPVLLTFDDAYVSYQNFVVPLLSRLGYPSVLSVVGDFIDNPPEGLAEPLMSWARIRAVAANPLVEIASHSVSLHRSIQYNPAGNVGAAVSVLAYKPETKAYESHEDYAARIKADFRKQRRLFSAKLGRIPRAIVWPYGRHNHVAWDIASHAGFQLGFSLEWGLGDVNGLHAVSRIMIENEPMWSFIEKVSKPAEVQQPIRAMQVDLDAVYDPAFEAMDANLGRLIDRLVAMKVNTVFLQAFADPDGDGNTDSVYFANRVLPVRADFFSHAAHQMSIRGMEVYAWMPMLAITLPDEAMNEAFAVQELHEGTIRPSRSWYARLTPFSSEVRRIVGRLYEDLAAHAQIAGILFQDDAYLGEHEDMHPFALDAFKRRFGEELRIGHDWQNPDQVAQWSELKTEALIDFSQQLMARVKKYRPEAKFARNLYAPALIEPTNEQRFGQNYPRFIDAYDQVVVMAYAQMEGAEKPLPWLKEMVETAKNMDAMALAKTVFKIQAYDWNANMWIDDGLLLDEIKTIIAAGGRHIAFYPDGLGLDKPGLTTIKMEMSTQDHPYLP